MEKKAGLLTSHISTGIIGYNLPSALFWVGGSKVKVTKQGIIKSQQGGGIRGAVTMFSAGSRRRLLRKLAEVDRREKPVFCTLTLPDEYYPYLQDYAHLKRVLKRFIQAFRRDYPDAGLVWRLELVTRKSGKYTGQLFPHFHLLVYNVLYIDTFRLWLSRVWYRSAGKLSEAHLKAGTQAVETEGGSRVIAYVSKYMAKPDPSVTPPKLGRVWGIVSPENIAFVKAVLVNLTPEEASDLLRYVRRFAGIKGRDYASLTVFLDAAQWWRRLLDLLHPN